MPFGIVGELELAEDACDVSLEGVLADAEVRRDRGVGPSLGHAGEHVELALAQLVERTAPAPAIEHLGDHLGVERGAAACHLSDRLREAARLHDPVLEQIADARRAQLEQLDRVALLDVLGEDDDSRLRTL